MPCWPTLSYFKKKIRYFCFLCCSKNCSVVLVKLGDTLRKFSFENNFLMVPFAVLCLGLRTNLSCRLKICSVCGCILDVFRAYMKTWWWFFKKWNYGFSKNVQTRKNSEKLCISVPVHLIPSYFRDWSWNFLKLAFDISWLLKWAFWICGHSLAAMMMFPFHAFTSCKILEILCSK